MLELMGAAEAVGRNARRKAAINVIRILTGRIPRATTRTVGACFLIDHLSGLEGRLVGNDQAKIADGSWENNYRGMVTERRRLPTAPVGQPLHDPADWPGFSVLRRWPWRHRR